MNYKARLALAVIPTVKFSKVLGLKLPGMEQHLSGEMRRRLH